MIDQARQIDPAFTSVEDGALAGNGAGIDTRRDGRNLFGAKTNGIVGQGPFMGEGVGDLVAVIVCVPC